MTRMTRMINRLGSLQTHFLIWSNTRMSRFVSQERVNPSSFESGAVLYVPPLSVAVEMVVREIFRQFITTPMRPSSQLSCRESHRLSLLAKSDLVHPGIKQAPHSRPCSFRGHRASVASLGLPLRSAE